MNITIIGSGCPTCEKLHNMVLKLKEEKKIDGKIKYLKDVNELVKRGIMGSPALLVNDKVVNVGMPKDENELLKIIKKSE